MCDFVSVCVSVCVCVCVFAPMPTHCTITRFGFRASRKDGVECGPFSIQATLGETTLCGMNIRTVYCRKLRLGWLYV